MKTLDQIIQEGKERFDNYYFALPGKWAVGREQVDAFLSSFAREVAEGALESVKLNKMPRMGSFKKEREGWNDAAGEVASRARAFLEEKKE